MTFHVTRQSDDIAPPMRGGVLGIQVTTAAVGVDLTTVPGSPADQSAPPGTNNPCGAFVTIQSDVDLYWQMADTLAHAKAIVTTCNGSVSGTTGAVTVSATDAAKIPAGSVAVCRVPLGPDNYTSRLRGSNSLARYLGLVTAAGTANVRIWASSTGGGT